MQSNEDALKNLCNPAYISSIALLLGGRLVTSSMLLDVMFPSAGEFVTKALCRTPQFLNLSSCTYGLPLQQEIVVVHTGTLGLEGLF
jgi:hypothetical protein